MEQTLTVIIGLDIGEKHHGVAVIDAETRSVGKLEICDGKKLIESVESLRSKDISIVGIEQFLLYPWHAQNQSWKTFVNIEIIGVIKYILGQQNIPYIMIKAVQSKKVYSKERMKKLGYRILRDPQDHKKDALSVALYAADRIQTNSKRVVNARYKNTLPERS